MPHTLTVEGDKVIEKSASGEVIKTSDYDHVIRGYKATLHRENVSDEAKAEARALLHDLEKAHETAKAGGATGSTNGKAQHQRRKSNAHGEGAKTVEQAEGRAKTHRDEVSGEEVPLPHDGETHEEMVHRHRVAGTYKGILHRADVSEDAKNHAREILDKMGVAHDD